MKPRPKSPAGTLASDPSDTKMCSLPFALPQRVSFSPVSVVNVYFPASPATDV